MRNGTDRRNGTRAGADRRDASKAGELMVRNAERIGELLSFPTTLHETPDNERAREKAETLARCNSYLLTVATEG